MCDKMQRIVDEEVREVMKQAEKEKADAIYKLTVTTDWTNEHIADVFGTTADVVAKIRMEIDK